MTLISRSSIIFLAFTFLPTAPLWSAEFTVNDTTDAVDADLKDGKCETINKTCTLRAAIQESNVDFDKDTIIIPPGIYTLTLKSTPGDLAAEGVEKIPEDKLPAPALSAAGGDLDIVSNLEIKKSDEAGEVILDGADKFRFFDMQFRKETDKDLRTPEVTLTDLKFINGAAITHGGAIQCSCTSFTLNNIYFENNSSNGHGGALSNYSGKTTLNNVTFTDNSADGFGGALASPNWKGLLTIKNSSFTRNKSGSSGGAVYIDGNILLIEDSQFNRNSGKEGGALFIYQATSTLSNLTIENNTSKTSGGAIYQKEGELEINKKTIISDNKSDLSGAGLFINLGILTINKDIETVIEPVLIENNVSKTSGGALYLHSNKTPSGVFIQPIVNINHAVFNNNNALGSSGGAIRASARITLNNVNITNNDSKTNGAGIFLSDESSLVWKEGELKDNKSNNNGGGIYIERRSSADLNAITIENNWADNGAGIYSKSNGLLRVIDSQILNNKTNSASEYFGAGIFLKSAIAMISGSTFDGNGTSTDNSGTIAKGGAILSEGSNLYIFDSLFENNRAVSGGAINSLKTEAFIGHTTLNKVTLKNNRSTLYGGAIYHEIFGQLTLINSIVTDNQSIKRGGGISALGPITVTYSTLNGNHSENGGGLYNESSALIENSTISGNTANKNGGGIYNSARPQSKITVNNSTLAFNDASIIGSNIFADETVAGETIYHGEVTIENSIISNAASGNNCSGRSEALISKGYNLSDDTSCYFTQGSDQSETPPLLEATLSTIENSSLYHALTSNSPAMSRANNATCVITDQRYHERPGNTCDIGAYESNSNRINSGSIQFSQNIYQRSEQSKAAEITVTRTGSSQGLISIELFDMRNGTASETTTLPVNPTGFKDYLRITNSLGDSTGSQTILSNFIRKLEWADGDAQPISFKIKLANDTHNEGTETINLGLRNPTNGAVLGENSETVLEILDDDTDAGLFAFEKTNYTVTEGKELTIMVRRTGGAQGDVSVDFETVLDDGKNCEEKNRKGTLIPATAGEDYESVTGTLSFAEDENEKTFIVKILANPISEKDETIKLILKNPTNGSSLHGIQCTSVIFIDDSHPGEFQFLKTEISIKENNNDNALIVVERLDSFNGEVTIDYNLTAGTAVAGEDYQDISGTLLFTDGEKSTSFIIPILDDSTFEAQDEALTINLFNPKSLTMPDFPVLFRNQTATATATLTIEDNDIEDYTPGIFSFTGVSSSTFDVKTLTGSIEERFSSTWDEDKKDWILNEGFDKDTSDIILTVTRTEGSDSEVTIGYRVIGGTATEGQHFKSNKETITFAEGESGSKTFLFSVYDDPFWSEDKTVKLGLTIKSEGGPNDFIKTDENPDPPQTAALGEPITLTFIDNESKPEDPGQFAFNVASYSASETSGVVEVKVLRNGGTEGTVRVDLSTVSLVGIESNAATPHVDFTPRENIPIAFKTGQASKTISITILLDEDENESEEIFQLQLQSPQGGATLALRRTTASVIIKEATQEDADGNTKKLPGGPDAYSGTGALSPWIFLWLLVLFSRRFIAK